MAEVFVVLPWINVHADDEVQGAQRVAHLEHVANQLPGVDYGGVELLRDVDGDQEEWRPPDTVEAATDRMLPYLGRTWLRAARAYGPAPRPFFVVRSYEPNPEARR